MCRKQLISLLLILAGIGLSHPSMTKDQHSKPGACAGTYAENGDSLRQQAVGCHDNGTCIRTINKTSRLSKKILKQNLQTN